MRAWWALIWDAGWWIADPFWRGVVRGYVRTQVLCLPVWVAVLGHVCHVW